MTIQRVDQLRDHGGHGGSLAAGRAGRRPSAAVVRLALILKNKHPKHTMRCLFLRISATRTARSAVRPDRSTELSVASLAS